MQLRPRPEYSTFVDNSTSDDDSPQQDPWPQQEVWPEEDMMRRSMRTGWTANDVAVMPRSHSSQVGANFGSGNTQPNPNPMRESRSVHAQLRFTPCEHDHGTRPRL
ncbi:unnamed protein product, partial [Cylicostephanus goldi]